MEEFENVSRGEETKHPVLKINKTLGNQFTSIARKGIEQTSVAISFYSVGEDSNKTEIAQLLGTALGGGTSSRLVFKIREEMGACHRISAGSYSLSTYGVFYIQTGISSNNFDRVIKQIAVECGRLKTELIGDDELEKTKQILIGRTLNDHRNCQLIGHIFIFHNMSFTSEIITIEESINRINKVTAT